VFSSAQNVTFKEYQLNGFPSPTSITAGPDGALWFTEYLGNKIGRITTTGVITEYPVQMVGSELSQLGAITAGPDGALWFTESFASKIGRITTAGVLTEYTTAARPGAMTVGADGALWFTLGSAIGRITTTGTITEYPLPTGRGPTDITLGPDGALWFIDISGNRIGRMTTDGVLTAEYSLSPISCLCAVPAGITAGPDGALWFGKDIDKVGRISTTGVVTVYPLAPHSWPGHFTVGPDGALWFTENGGGSIAQAILGKIGRITTTGVITEYPIPTDYPFPGGLTVGPDDALWFTEQLPGKIGQVVLSDTTPPVITLFASQKILWPPSGKIVPVTVFGTISDSGSGVNANSAAYSVNDEYGEVQPMGAITLGPGGNYSFTVLLEASRQGSDLDGRRYTVTVRAKDNVGNGGSKATVVTVPHDQRH
jgi:virginiamycin B lyase